MSTSSSYCIAIIPPQLVRSALYAYMDKIRNQVTGRCPNLPHIALTGFDGTYAEMEQYSERLTDRLLLTPAFRLNLGKPQIMSHFKLPRNLALPVYSSEQLERVRDIVLSQTVAVAKEFNRDELDALVHHMVIIENFQRASVGLAVKVSNQYWEDYSFTVDRLYLVENKDDGLFIRREIPLLGYKNEDIRDPATSDSEMLLAMLFAYRKALHSKIRLHKLMWLLGESFMLGHALPFAKAPLGPYSHPLELMTRSLSSESLLAIKAVALHNGRTISEYSLTDEGLKVAAKCYMIFREQYGVEIAAMLKEFGDMPLKPLLDYVHKKWPNMREPSLKGEDTG